MMGFPELMLGDRNKKEIEATRSDLLTRIRDLELAIGSITSVMQAHEDKALRRIIHRTNRYADAPPQWEGFIEAWRSDLELAYISRLHEEKGDPQSVAAALNGFQAAKEGSWEWAQKHFRQAYESCGHWHRSLAAVNPIVEALNQEPPPTPRASKIVEEMFERFEVVDEERDAYLDASVKAESPLEWIEAFYKFSKRSRVFKGFITEELLEVAREGKWEEWITAYLKEGGFFTTPGSKDDGKLVVKGPGPGRDVAGTKLNKYLGQFQDEDLKANKDRIWSVFWWACGFLPRLDAVKKPVPTQKNGKWYLMMKCYSGKMDGPFKEAIEQFDKLPDGYETKEKLIAAVWRYAMYK